MKKTIILAIIIVAIIVIAWHRVAHGQTTDPSKPIYYCPEISLIQKNPVKMNWYAHTPEGLWKSYDLSFASAITQFSGAEWVGENVGQIFCVYKSVQQMPIDGVMQTQATLPVVLVFGTLAPVPAGKSWKHTRRGVRTCNTVTATDCPFSVNLKPKAGNIYQEAESLKFNKSDTINSLSNE